jgi:hypothetical protein
MTTEPVSLDTSRITGLGTRPPGPSVVEPERRQDMELGWLWSGVARGDANQDIVRRGLGVVRSDLPISIACVEKPKFRLVLVRLAFSCRRPA